MKKIITITAMMFTSLLFTACGGGGGGSTTGTTTAAVSNTTVSSTITPLSIGVATEIAPGYKVVNSSDDAVLDILVSGESRTVVLKSGTASLSIPN